MIFAILAIPLIQIALGYHFQPGWEVARNLVEHGNSVQECEKVRVMPWNMIGPTESQQRSLCIHEYAKLTKDPSACELLMPSSYGWSCLGAAEEPNQRWCWFDFGHQPPLVGRGETSVTMPECKDNPSSMQENRCCELALVLYVNHEMSCETFSQGPQQLHDQCLELLAVRERNIDFCSSIANENVRKSCEVATKALGAVNKL